jgi:hypothetical protein
LSRQIAKDAVLEVLVRPAAEEDVGNSLLPLPTATVRASNVWYFLGKEEVV